MFASAHTRGRCIVILILNSEYIICMRLRVPIQIQKSREASRPHPSPITINQHRRRSSILFHHPIRSSLLFAPRDFETVSKAVPLLLGLNKVMPSQFDPRSSRSRESSTQAKRGISSRKMVAAWLCLSTTTSFSTGARATFVRSSLATRSSAFVHSFERAGNPMNRKGGNHQRRVSLTTLSSSSTAVDSVTAYDTINKEKGLDKYDPSSFESEIYKWWESSGCFDPDAKQKPTSDQGSPYVLPMPPPNVTGRLHMGHAIFVALQDVLARFHRMRGRPVLWLPGRSKNSLLGALA